MIFENHFPNLNRAVEIAIADDLSIGIYSSYDYPQFEKDAGIIIQEYFPVNIQVLNPENPVVDMFIDIARPQYQVSRGKPIKVFIKNLITQQTEDNVHPAGVNPKLSVVCENLLKTGIEKMSFGFADLSGIQKMTHIIAALDHSDKIEAHHLAEAMQYRFLYSDKKDRK